MRRELDFHLPLKGGGRRAERGGRGSRAANRSVSGAEGDPHPTLPLSGGGSQTPCHLSHAIALPASGGESPLYRGANAPCDRTAAAGRRDPRLVLPADRVDCWFVPLAAFPADARAAAFALLSAEEQERAHRFYFDQHRELYVRSHAALRLLLARYVAVPAGSIIIAPDQSGRPILAEPAGALHFNLSHSGEAALVAVAAGAPVGVDLEFMRTLVDFLDIAERFFAPAEVADLRRLDAEQRLGAFYVTWTRKEAFVKGLGLGLSYPLHAFCTGAQDRPPLLTRADGTPHADWMMADLAPAQGYKAAVVVQLPQAAIQYREAPWPWLLEGLQQPSIPRP